MPQRPPRDPDGRPDRPAEDRSGGRSEPGFDWLYGSGGGSSGSGGGSGPDPEPTMRIPVSGRPDAADAPTQPIDPAGASSRRPPAGPYQTPPLARRPEQRSPGRPGGPGGPPRRIAPTPGGPGGRTRRLRPRPRWLLVLLALWLVFLVVVPLLAWQKVVKVDATPRVDRPAEQPGRTYLLVGSDSRAGLTRAQKRAYATGDAAGRRTDSIMLLHTGSGPDLLMSIPRDSLVPVPGHGTTKINAAFAFGGPRLLVRTIEQDTGIRVDDYVEIGFAGFVDVVDAVHGIQICPTNRMDDRRADLHIKRGCQQVDGRTALGYARSRHTQKLGDIDRARHQREVVSAVGKKAVSPWSVLNPVRYARLNFAAANSVQVGDNVSPFAMAGFAVAMTRVNGSTGLTCGVPISDLAVHWDPQRSQQMFAFIKQDRTGDIPKRLCRPSGLTRG